MVPVGNFYDFLPVKLGLVQRWEMNLIWEMNMSRHRDESNGRLGAIIDNKINKEVYTLKGLVKYAKGDGNMEIREIAEPTAGPGQIKIEIKAAGICGSDLHIYHDDIAGIPINPPVVTGH